MTGPLQPPVDPALGLLYGRRRIGTSTSLVKEVEARSGFYFEATRVGTPLQLDHLGRAIGEHPGAGRVALANWEEAVTTLLCLGSDVPTP